MKSVKVLAPAKINLHLEILKKREDNYHEVEMIMQTVSLCDSIIVTKTDDKNIRLTSDYHFSGPVTKNTAYKAAKAFFEESKLNSGINIKIEKKIPICAGLAGGSSDAAAVLVALNKLFSTNYSKSDLALIGKKVGADVPFCVFGGTMLATGIGTALLPLNYVPSCYIVLCKPNLYVSTKEAYSKFDDKEFNQKEIKNMLLAISKKSIFEISNCLYNRFENILNLKVIDKIKKTMKKYGVLSACMSGSGPTVFGIFNSKDEAVFCAKILEKYYKNVFLCQTQNFGCFIEEVE